MSQCPTLPPPPLTTPPLCNPPLPHGRDRHFDGFLTRGCCVVLCVLVPPMRVDFFFFSDTMYARSDHVWYHSRSRGVPLLATVIWPSPSGPEFLHIQYRGTVNVVDHTAAKSCRLKAARASSTVLRGSPNHSPQPALTATSQAPPPTLQAPIPKPAPKRGVKWTLQTSMDQFLKPNTPVIDDMP